MDEGTLSHWRERARWGRAGAGYFGCLRPRSRPTSQLVVAPSVGLLGLRLKELLRHGRRQRPARGIYGHLLLAPGFVQRRRASAPDAPHPNHYAERVCIGAAALRLTVAIARLARIALCCDAFALIFVPLTEIVPSFTSPHSRASLTTFTNSAESSFRCNPRKSQIVRCAGNLRSVCRGGRRFRSSRS